ncbi:hypothetical protein AXF14_09280 [Actinomyces radicidentis]|uniref:Glycerol-3-phosphate responsive antiterminator n=1 Tax=Actinomyces radicidentis TaxID=111015 RepID=A0A0X8JF78_ACTRD|nr:glycerol-3-phosphate responsive antiterminator [Actinomyces radicidentis]AMD87742.1 hypothetical protein AXF14_09280 [Actinomyces radicidentis]
MAVSSVWRVIPSVRNPRQLEQALASPSDEVLLTGVHIGNLAALARRARESGKEVMVHSDLVGGFRADTEGIRLLANEFHVDTVFSSSLSTLAAAKRTPLKRYLRIFLVDSRSLDKAVESISGFDGDGVELLPGPVAGYVLDEFRSLLPGRQILAGGFVRSRQTLAQLKAVGFDGVTTSCNSMWSDLDEVHPWN